MQRLRSPFRLRPGPGSEQRKAKGRKEELQAPATGAAPAVDARRSPEHDTAGAPTAGTAGPDIRHKITGASLRKRRAEEDERDGEPGDAPRDAPSGSK